MRLTCPNCKAQYEVDDIVIPESGRDVQCSACGQTWYQYPAHVAFRMENTDEEDEPATEATATPSARAAPKIDNSVLDVLREEAEREIGERRRGNGALEMQGDLGLVTRPRARGVAEPDPEADTNATDNDRPASRRNLLPDIEELSSTLEPRRDPRRKGAADIALPPTETDERRGFRRGFLVVLFVAILLMLPYLFATELSAYLPALAEGLEAYVALVDGLRLSLNQAAQGLLARIGGAG